MESRRSFIVFIMLRFLAWGTATAIIVGFLVGIGVFDQVPIEQLVAIAIVGIVSSFFEFDSLPRKIEIGERNLIRVDPSGEEIVTSEFGVRRFLWLTRVVTCRNRRVLNIPLEAYQSTSELTKIARRGIRKRAEQNAAG
ncbi:MAG: hypothetical protein CMO55_09120 [Verrucomicrobiales bacterium]|nr:hypothetical protein [Verrucomicrobiales bacterium]